jgi:4'-phosphopantetheinyl transferase EntD
VDTPWLTFERSASGGAWAVDDDSAIRSVFSRQLPDHVVMVVLDEDDPGVSPLLPAETDLLSSRAVPSRRRSFTAGRSAARQALELLGWGAPPVLQGAHREPLWPPGVVGSITHAGGHAIVAVARADLCGGIGIDLEERGRWFPDLDRQIAFDRELQWLSSLSGDARARATLELFSAKESVYKAFFPRVERFFGFAAVRLRVAPGADWFLGHFVEPLDPEYAHGRSFRVDRRWHGDLVLTSIVLPPRGRRMDSAARGATAIRDDTLA